jgi:hypothetical protein
VLLYNGQEVGEDGSGNEGFGGEDGKTTLFDYWSLPPLAALASNKTWDGSGLSTEQASLRSYYRDLLKLSQEPSVRGSGYWALRYFNGQLPSLLPVARFVPGSGRLLVVVANFQAGSAASGAVRLPPELLAAAGIQGAVDGTKVLDEEGAQAAPLGSFSPEQLTAGFPVSIPEQSAHVFVFE